MNAVQQKHNWTPFFKLFSEQNNGRSTRLGVIENASVATIDYWIEDNLPLAGIDVDARDEAATTIEIMLGEAGSHHLTHTVNKARFVKIVLSISGEADGLEIENVEGKTTVLRFEK